MVANLHAKAVPSDILAEAHTKLKEVYALILSYLVTLTPRERQYLFTAGEKTWSFLDKAYSLAVEYPHLLPAFQDLNEFKTDFTDAYGLRDIRNTAKLIFTALDDTLLAANSEATQAALNLYKSAKLAAAQDIPGGKLVYEELKKRFPSSRRKPDGSPETPVTPV
jgi:hypothetical protein